MVDSSHERTRPETPEPGLIRLFIGIPIGDDVRARLGETCDLLKKTHAHVGWVPPRNYHLSLAFLGDTPRDMVPELGEALDDAVTCGAFSFAVTGVGTFGSLRSPRVIWAGVEAPKALITLLDNVRNNLAALDLLVDRRPFRAHITLGRVRSSRGKSDLSDALVRVSGTGFGTVAATTVHLYRSVLQPGGSVYAVMHASMLKDDGRTGSPF